MQNLPLIELAKRAMRLRVCRTCIRRPEGSESFGPIVPRGCESSCPNFLNVSALQDITHDIETHSGVRMIAGDFDDLA